jgi:hypothetical protein
MGRESTNVEPHNPVNLIPIFVTRRPLKPSYRMIMKNQFTASLTLLAIGLSCTLCHAEKGTDLKPVLVTPGKQIVDESFTDAALGKMWTVAKGEWKPQDGTLVGKEKKEDMHPAVLMLGKPNHDSIIRFSFKMDGAKGFNLSYNKAKGHLFRISIEDASLIINKDKDMADAKSKNLQLGQAAAKFEQGKWYTMMVEIKGPQVTVQTDNGVKLTASNPEINTEKNGYRFVTRSGPLLIDHVSVWEAAQ